MESPLVFYDGKCGMCNWVVQFILRHEHSKLCHFTPLEGETGRKLLPHWAHKANTIVLIEDPGAKEPTVLIRSKAVFRVCWLMGGPWRVPGLLSFLPGFLFDWAYRIVAANRYRVFGYGDSCIVPSEEERSRFLP